MKEVSKVETENNYSKRENTNKPLLNREVMRTANFESQQYEVVCSFSEGLAGVQKNGKWGFIDKTGKLIIPLEYDYVSSFSKATAYVKKDGREFYINPKGECVKDCP